MAMQVLKTGLDIYITNEEDDGAGSFGALDGFLYRADLWGDPKRKELYINAKATGRLVVGAYDLADVVFVKQADFGTFNMVGRMHEMISDGLRAHMYQYYPGWNDIDYADCRVFMILHS